MAETVYRHFIPFEVWKNTDVHRFLIGPATVSINRWSRSLELYLNGEVLYFPLIGSGILIAHNFHCGSLRAEDDLVENRTDFFLTLHNSASSETGSPPTSYIPTTSTANLLCDNRAFTAEVWGAGGIDAMRYWNRQLSQEEMKGITSPTVARNKKVLLLAT